MGPFEVQRGGRIPYELIQAAQLCVLERGGGEEDGDEVLYFLLEDRITALGGRSERDASLIADAVSKGAYSPSVFCAMYREGQRTILREAMDALSGEWGVESDGD